MLEELKPIIEKIKSEIIKDLPNKSSVFNLVLAAFNRYQEAECDGIDYIFNLYNSEDLVYLVKGGVTANNIHEAVEKLNGGDIVSFFHYGQNYEKLTPIGGYKELEKELIDGLDYFLPYVFAYVDKVKEYGELYEYYVTKSLEEEFYS